jgi:hypothetical protein
MFGKEKILKYINSKGCNATEIIKVEVGPITSRVFYKDENGEVNVMGIITAVLMLVVGVSLAAMFMGIFPATTGTAIQSMNVTSSNPMYSVVSAVPAQAAGWFSMTGTVMYLGIAAVLAAIGLSIFVYTRQ